VPHRLVLLAALAAACGPPSPESYNPNAATDYKVVLVTLDGVRWQEFFNGSDPLLTPNATKLFPLFWDKLASRGKVYGDPSTGSRLNVATMSNASLPGYTSIFAEVDQGCLTNFCKRVTVPTFLDRLSDELSLPQDQLAVFASWPKLRLAVTGRDEVALVHAGDHDLSNEATHPQRALLEDTLEHDRGTVLHGFQYLADHQPRFFYLSLLDSDRFGHQNNYPRYVEVLGTYDRLLSELADRLDSKTALIITTDHGRGLWDQWQDHGPQTPSSGRVWAFVMLPPDATELSLTDPKARAFTHHDIRYTIETLFGLSTKSSARFSTGFIER
jgi:hypothetical protein